MCSFRIMLSMYAGINLTPIYYIMKHLKQTILSLTLVLLCSSATVCHAKRHQPKAKAKHVVLIGIDGWAAKSIAAADMPCVKGTLMANGSYTLKKRSVLPSASAINWTSVFWVSVPKAMATRSGTRRCPRYPRRLQTSAVSSQPFIPS